MARSKTSSLGILLVIQAKECHVDSKKAQGCVVFTLLALTQVTQAVTSKDCQLGNPFVHILDPRAKIDSPMSEIMKGTVILLACSIPIGWAYAFHQDKASSVRVPVANVTLSSSAHLLRENTDSFPLFATGISLGSVFLLGLLALAIVAACASKAAAMPSAISCWMAAKVMAGVSDDSTEILEFKTSRDKYGDNGMSDPIGGLVFKDSSRTGSSPSGRVDLTGDEDPTDEDGDTEMGDLTGVSVSLGGEIFSGGKKSPMIPERITKKRTKNKAKTTKPDSEWKSKEKTKPKSTEVNPSQSRQIQKSTIEEI
ncbi:hypothetical protein Tco_0400371 [Tanacetum coccineum]